MLEFLIFICIFSIATITYKIIGQQKCVDESTLRRFMARRMREGERDQIIAHLGICEKCQQKLEKINFGKQPKNQK